MLRSALTTLLAKHPHETAMIAVMQVGLGRSLMALGRTAEAWRLVEPAVLDIRSRYGPDDWRTAEALLATGEILLERREYHLAEPALVQAHRTLDRQRRAQPQLAAQSGRALRRLYQAWRRPVEAHRF